MKLLYDDQGNVLTHRRDERTARAEIVWEYEEEPVRRLVGITINDRRLRRSFPVTGSPDAIRRYFAWIAKGDGQNAC